MKNILTNEQVKKAIYLDDDFDDDEMLGEYASWATSFISQKIGMDPTTLPEGAKPIAVDCAKMLIRNRHFEQTDLRDKYEYTMGINNAITDLQDIVRGIKNE